MHILFKNYLTISHDSIGGSQGSLLDDGGAPPAAGEAPGGLMDGVGLRRKPRTREDMKGFPFWGGDLAPPPLADVGSCRQEDYQYHRPRKEVGPLGGTHIHRDLHALGYHRPAQEVGVLDLAVDAVGL